MRNHRSWSSEYPIIVYLIYLIFVISWVRLSHSIFGSQILLHLRMANEGVVPSVPFERLHRFIKETSKAVFSSKSIKEPGFERAPKPSRTFGDIEEWLAPEPTLYPSYDGAVRIVTSLESGSVESINTEEMSSSNSSSDLTLPWWKVQTKAKRKYREIHIIV